MQSVPRPQKPVRSRLRLALSYFKFDSCMRKLNGRYMPI